MKLTPARKALLLKLHPITPTRLTVPEKRTAHCLMIAGLIDSPVIKGELHYRLTPTGALLVKDLKEVGTDK